MTPDLHPAEDESSVELVDVDVSRGTAGDDLVVEWMKRLLDRADPGVGSGR